MSIVAYNQNITFDLINCCNCYGSFMLTTHSIKELKNEKGTFYCPYCKCPQGWFDDNEIDRLKSKLAAVERGKKLAEYRATNAQNQARAQKAAKTRLKNRIKNGICPCCQRTFKQLVAHMKNKHPGYTP